MDMSIKKLLCINRGIIPNNHLIYPINNDDGESEIVDVVYTSDSFGINVINSHFSIHDTHSSKCNFIFDKILSDNSVICYESRNTNELGNTLVSFLNVYKPASSVKADMVFMPYVNGASYLNMSKSEYVLCIGSHYDNDSTDGKLHNGDRHDITDSPSKFLQYSIAVAARRDTPSEWNSDVTSYGYGVEFFEDCSPEALDIDYPDENIEIAAAEVTTDSTGTIITTSVHLGFANYFNIGDYVNLHYSTNVKSQILEIIDGNTIRVDSTIAGITESGVYLFGYGTLANYIGQQAQSWAVPIVAAKLKKIQLATGASWSIIRNAARLTARRNPTGIPEIDNSNWDMYRGFGSIDVEASINYINNN